MFKIFFACLMLLSFLGCKRELKTVVAEKYPNGSVKKEVSFYKNIGDPRKIVFYTPDGKIKSLRYLKNGKSDSLEQIYYPNGKLYKEAFYIQTGGTTPASAKSVKHGKETYWYENGQIKSVAEYDSGAPVGTAVRYFEDGTKSYEVSFKNGKKEGDEISYFKNGKMEYKIPYVAGDRQGIAKYWYESGKLKKEDSYVKNILDGICFTYHKNGKKETSTTYKDGRLNGVKKEWTASGRLIAKAVYKNGELESGEHY